MPSEAALFLLAALAVLAAPILAIVALARVRRLERPGPSERPPAGVAEPTALRIAAIEQRLLRLESAVATRPAIEPVRTAPVASEVVTVSEGLSLAAEPGPSSPIEAPPILVPPEPAAHGGFDWETLIAGRWLNRVGLLTMAVAVACFLKIAIDNAWIGPAGQVALGALFGAALLATGPWFIARGYTYFANGLTGLGGAVLYLSLWAGHSYYGLFSPAVAFVTMILVTSAMLAIAIGRQSQAVAVMALVGGFVTPALVSTGRDAELILFGYLALLNAAFLPLAGARGWRFLEAPAFFFTQLYFWGWAFSYYGDDRLVRTTAFTALFFVEFVAVPVLHSRRTGAVFVEQALLAVVNASACVLALSFMMWTPHRWWLTIGVLLLSAVHVALAEAVPRHEGRTPQARLLFAGLAIMLLTAVVPLRFEQRWIPTAWAVEGALLMWTGLEHRVGHLRGLAFALFGAVVLGLLALPFPATGVLLNVRFLAESVTVISSAAALKAAHRHWASLAAPEQALFTVLGVAVNAIAVWALTTELHLYFRPDPFSGLRPDVSSVLAEGLAISLLWAVYAGGLMWFGLRRAVAALRWQGLVLLGVTTIKVFAIDLSVLSGFYRVASSFALGAVLLLVSFLYQRNVAAAQARERA